MSELCIIKLPGDEFLVREDSYCHFKYLKVFDSEEDAKKYIASLRLDGAWVERLYEEANQ